MKNRIGYILIAVVVLSGCIKNVLDRKPLNLISDSDVWQSKQLAEVYLTALYDALPIGFTTSPAGFQTYYTDESSYHEETTVTKDPGNLSPFLNTTMYTWIRRANYFLQQIKTSSIAETDKKSLAAECRFIRAYYYFDLVKKYGGMPIIAQVQTFEGSNL
ncbi:MAG: RagB/SusD family nutrient uptake outer membrane protein, partial [Chitinophagaceae bacterium]